MVAEEQLISDVETEPWELFAEEAETPKGPSSTKFENHDQDERYWEALPQGTITVTEDGTLVKEFDRASGGVVALQMMVSKEVQLLKVTLEIYVTEEGMVTEVRPLQPEKAWPSMDVTELGIVTVAT